MSTGYASRHSLITFVINLDRAEDRLHRIRANLDRIGLPFERVSAIDGQQLVLPIRQFSESRYRLFHGRRPNPAEIGCFLSHIECAERLLASSFQYALVIEDDVDVAEDLPELLEAALHTQHAWDILRLSTVSSGKKHRFHQLTAQRSLAISLTREKGSGAYLINRDAARWFVKSLLPMRLPFDLAFDLEFLAGLKSAFIDPVPICQNTGLPSQIQLVQGKRRSFHLPRWTYATVIPYRLWLEFARIALRLVRLVNVSLLGALPVEQKQRETKDRTPADLAAGDPEVGCESLQVCLSERPTDCTRQAISAQ
ncbi:glycosyltransferase family 25 protein [Rhizobium sp. BK376]|uniref:glycosyltransferase family 25 protein n=1 Tax=Rhizobium sp. BK376 TaxID=2512149 RepID=UPI001FDFFD09|nr:glycosyltransferase family 25 protein [Rhizobium sp. BK376]